MRQLDQEVLPESENKKRMNPLARTLMWFVIVVELLAIFFVIAEFMLWHSNQAWFTVLVLIFASWAFGKTFECEEEGCEDEETSA